jgi:hypothetical protein
VLRARCVGVLGHGYYVTGPRLDVPGRLRRDELVLYVPQLSLRGDGSSGRLWLQSASPGPSEPRRLTRPGRWSLPALVTCVPVRPPLAATLIGAKSALRPTPRRRRRVRDLRRAAKLGRRVEFLGGQLERLDDLIVPLVTARTLGLLSLYGALARRITQVQEALTRLSLKEISCQASSRH